MRNFLVFMRGMLMDMLIFGLLFAWKYHGVNGAGNIFVGLVWFVAIVSIAIGLVNDTNDFKIKIPAGYMMCAHFTDAVMALLLLWFGMFWLASFYVFGALLVDSARYREPKVKS